jgi:hypothetical protein
VLGLGLACWLKFVAGTSGLFAVPVLVSSSMKIIHKVRLGCQSGAQVRQHPWSSTVSDWLLSTLYILIDDEAAYILIRYELSLVFMRL